MHKQGIGTALMVAVDCNDICDTVERLSCDRASRKWRDGLAGIPLVAATQANHTAFTASAVRHCCWSGEKSYLGSLQLCLAVIAHAFAVNSRRLLRGAYRAQSQAYLLAVRA